MNLARRGLCGIDQAAALNGVAVLIEDGEVIGWRSKIRAIKNVENLGSELRVESFRYAPDIVVLEHGKVQLRESRPDDGIAAEVPVEVRTRTGNARTSGTGWRNYKPCRRYEFGRDVAPPIAPVLP